MTKQELKDKLIEYKDGGNSIDGILWEIENYLSVSLPDKEKIKHEAACIYDGMNESPDPEDVRQAKTAQLFFIAGAWFARDFKVKGLRFLPV